VGILGSTKHHSLSGIQSGLATWQARSAERRQGLLDSMQARREGFWSRIRAAERREEEARRRNTGALRNVGSSVAGFFRTIGRREDQQRQDNKASLASAVNSESVLQAVHLFI
jgi:hypothetical protein